MKPVAFIGAAWGLGARDSGCSAGPLHLAQRLTGEARWRGIDGFWKCMVTPLPDDEVPALCACLRDEIADCVDAEMPWVVLGGDHTCAIGTWSGVARARNAPFGLIWIDAHMDAHTPETSPSGALHGMPVAALLGVGSPALLGVGMGRPVVRPAHIRLIGVRDFEPAEQRLLESLRVRVYYMDEVRRRGLTTVLGEAIEALFEAAGAFGISIDLDAVDPHDAPGVGTPAAGGIGDRDLCSALHGIAEAPGFLGLEIAEFNPARDIDDKTARLVCALIVAALSPTKRGCHETLHESRAQLRRV